MAGREPPSEQRLEGQPGYSEELRVHHLRHPAPIMATQLTGTQDTGIRAMRRRATGTQAIRDTPPTPVLRAMDTQVIRVSPAMDIRATRKGSPTPVLRALEIKAMRALPIMPVPRAMGTRADLGSRITPLLPAMDIPANQNIPMNTRVMRDTRHTPFL